MEKSQLLYYLSPYFHGNDHIENFINDSENYLNSIKSVNNIDDFFAYCRIHYDYSLHLINEGKISKAITYLETILKFINKHEHSITSS